MADSSLASGLANLAAQDLVRVLDALALVRVGPAEAPDLGRDLAHLLAVGARHGHAVRLGLDLDLDPLGDVIDHRVRVAKGELHLGTLDLGAVTHADDIELLREAGGHAQHRVRDQGPQQAVLGALRTGLAGTLDRDHAILDLDRIAFEQRLRHLAPRAFGDERPVLNLYLGPAGHRDRHFSNARHLRYLLQASYQSSQRISPPTLRSRAWMSVNRPCDVETIPTPRPLRTGWISPARR